VLLPLNPEILSELAEAVHSLDTARGADTLADRIKKSSAPRPQCLPELRSIRRRIKAGKRQGTSPEEAIREHVEDTYPKLIDEKQIQTKVDNLARYLRLYRNLK
jgi:hypothetical protein